MPNAALWRRSRVRILRTGRDASQGCVRMRANKVGAGVRSSAHLLNIRSQNPRPFASVHPICQLEGLAVAIPWGFESPPYAPSNRARNDGALINTQTSLAVRRQPVVCRLCPLGIRL